jgi:hypothetical protein
MIKRQYDYYATETTYFTRFMDQLDTNAQSKVANEHVRAALKPYKATLAKSKARYRYNIKFNDPTIYLLFVIKYS